MDGFIKKLGVEKMHLDLSIQQCVMDVDSPSERHFSLETTSFSTQAIDILIVMGIGIPQWIQ